MPIEIRREKASLLKGFLLGLAASGLGLFATRSYLQHPALVAPRRPVDSQRPAVARQFSTNSWIWFVTAGAAALIFGLGSLRVLELMIHPLAILLLGITLANSLIPIVRAFERRIPRTFAIVLVYLLLILVLVGVGSIVVPPMVGQAQEVVTQIPDLINLAQQRLDRLSWLNRLPLTDSAASQASGAAAFLVSLPIKISSSFLEILLVIFISFYWLISMPSLNRFVQSLFPPGQRERVKTVYSRMGSAMGGFMRGSALNGLIVGICYYIGLSIIGVKFPLVLGILAGMLELIPVLGPIIAGALAVGIALLTSPSQALIVLVFVIVLQQLENNILVPNIMRTQTDISPLMAVLAIYVGGTVGGVLGAIVAIPLAAALRVIVVEVLAPAIRRRTGASSIQ